MWRMKRCIQNGYLDAVADDKHFVAYLKMLEDA